MGRFNSDIPIMMSERTKKEAAISPEYYATMGLSLNTRQGIAYASVEKCLAKYCGDVKFALDFGCGAGRSTRFLRRFGIADVLGVDTSEKMLAQASKVELAGTRYQIVDEYSLPFDDNAFDLGFSGIVFPEFSSDEAVVKSIKELARVTKHSGTVIILTCDMAAYVTSADGFECLLGADRIQRLTDGDPIPTRVVSTGEIFNDYYWSDDFFRASFKTAGLQTIEFIRPVASAEQREACRNLSDKSCYVIYVCKKSGKT